MTHVVAQCVGACLTALAAVSGVPSSVHDGDTLTINHHNIRLYGLDAPELTEAYGDQAREYLTLITRDQRVECHPTSTLPSYDRVVARCYLPDGRDIAQLMVEAGLALDCKRYSYGYYAKFEQSWARIRLRNKGYCHE